MSAFLAVFWQENGRFFGGKPTIPTLKKRGESGQTGHSVYRSEKDLNELECKKAIFGVFTHSVYQGMSNYGLHRSGA
jgi:hypothetical protein